MLRPEIPEALSALVMRLLAKTPEARPESAQAVFDEIRAIERQVAASRQRGSMAPKIVSPDATLTNIPGKPAKVADSILSSPSQLVDRRPARPLLMTTAGLIALIMALAVWFSHPRRFHWGPRPEFPPPVRDFRGPVDPDEFAPGDRPERPEPPPIEAVHQPPTAPPSPMIADVLKPKPAPPSNTETSHRKGEAPRPIAKDSVASSIPAPAPTPARSPAPAPPRPAATVDRQAPSKPAPPAAKSAAGRQPIGFAHTGSGLGRVRRS